MTFISESRRALLQTLPSVEEVVQSHLLQGLREAVPRLALVAAVRAVLERFREDILGSTEEDLAKLPDDRSDWILRIGTEAAHRLSPSLRPLINATGVIIHTNLGRSLLAPQAITALADIASHYSNLEFDLRKGERGSRYVHVEDLLCRLTGAEAVMIVNNNAGAVLIALNALANGREVVLSRGELVEIGGSFRMPDVMEQSGARLVEVGTTNKSHLRDYETAIGPDTALLLKVHTSNYRIVGFTQSVSLSELVDLGRKHRVPVMKDLGSGCLVDLGRWGLEPEPTVQDALRSGAQLVTFSGDKLLGGPQAGIILGEKSLVERIRRNPLNRALRIDKLTLAALEATLRLYWDPQEAIRQIPTLQMLTMDARDIRRRALRLARLVRKTGPPRLTVDVMSAHSQVGGGSLPLLELPTWIVAVSLQDLSAGRLELALRATDPPVVGRIYREMVCLDLRTVGDHEVRLLADLVVQTAHRLTGSSSEPAGGLPHLQ
jgi:L-seryl-tRNA(Ser) seleniumtransferase